MEGACALALTLVSPACDHPNANCSGWKDGQKLVDLDLGHMRLCPYAGESCF